MNKKTKSEATGCLFSPSLRLVCNLAYAGRGLLLYFGQLLHLYLLLVSSACDPVKDDQYRRGKKGEN